ILGELGMVHARMNDKVKTTEIINQLDSLRKPWEYGNTEYLQGRLYSMTGDLPKATEYISKALEKGQKFEMWVTFKHDPDLKALKNYEPYKKLISSLKD
ncbi:MAG: hypothetical protein M3R25_04540, partial [Bacteroidota bacterium]|nr:hypothetical protein [Bacteroidota bacterium]